MIAGLFEYAPFLGVRRKPKFGRRAGHNTDSEITYVASFPAEPHGKIRRLAWRLTRFRGFSGKKRPLMSRTST
jgi:hypothetical protein